MFVTIEALNWRWKTTYPQTRFRKTAIQKVRFLGHPLHLIMSIYNNADSILLTTKIRTHCYEISPLTSQRLPQPILHGVRQIGGNPAIDSWINRKPKEWVAQPAPKPISPLCQPTVPNESPSASNSQCIAGVFSVCGRCVVTPVNVVRCVNYVYVQKHQCKM